MICKGHGEIAYVKDQGEGENVESSTLRLTTILSRVQSLRVRKGNSRLINV
jgi:hypothetical protein